MNRKALFAALLMTGAVFTTGCGTKIPPADGEFSFAESTEPADPYPDLQNGDGQDARITYDDGTVITVTDDGSIIEQTADGLEWSYLSGTVKMVFPSDWDQRYLVRGTSVYCKKCWDKEENTGELFSLDFCTPEAMISGPAHTALIGRVKTLYATILVPETPNYDTDDPDLFAEYSDMQNDLDKVFPTASCLSTRSFKAISLANYVPVTEGASSKLFGTWLDHNDLAATYTRSAIFRSRDGAFGYRPEENTLNMGTFMLNKNAEHYVYNTEAWGDAGLVFLGGQVYRVTYYESDPMTMEFEALFPEEEDTAVDPLKDAVLTFNSESQEIYRNDTDETEAELDLNA